MLNVECSVQNAILMLTESKGCIPDSLEKSLLDSLFDNLIEDALENALLEETNLILDYLEQFPSLIDDLLDYVDKQIKSGYANCITIDQVHYMRLCELTLQRCNENTLVQFLKLFTCHASKDRLGVFLNLDCWNMALTHELKDLIAYDMEEYKLVNYQAKRIVLINKALSAIID